MRALPDQLIAAMALRRFLVNTGLTLARSRGDGHCLLYSTVRSWNSQLPSIKAIDVESVKADIFVEAVSNRHLYEPFLHDRRSLTNGLHRYLIHKEYNQRFGDAVPLIISNALHIDIDIVNEGMSGDYDVINVSPFTSQSIGKIAVHRRHDHFNGLVPADQRLAPKPKLQYSGDLLRSLQPANSKVHRTVRKTLFKLSIWKPQTPQQQMTPCALTSSVSPTDTVAIAAGKHQKSAPAVVSTSPVSKGHSDGVDTGRSDYDETPGEQYISTTLNSCRYVPHTMTRTRCLTTIKCTPGTQTSKSHFANACLLNCRSVCNKAAVIKDFIVQHDIDILGINETWLSSGDRDKHIVKDITPLAI